MTRNRAWEHARLAPLTAAQCPHVFAAVRSESVASTLNEARARGIGLQVSLRPVPVWELFPSADLLHAPDVLLLEIDAGDTRDMDALDRVMRRHFPGIPVLVTGAHLALSDMRRLLRLGVADFLPQPIAVGELVSALGHAVRAHRGHAALPPRGHLLAFLKAGGGVGATTLAAQAAVSLASRRKPGQGGVCLLDLDIQFGTTALYLDLDDRIGLAELLDDPQRLDGELLRSVMVQHRSGLDVLAAPRDVLGLDALAPEVLGTCLDLACAEYATVLLDLPQAWTPWSYQAVQRCDLAILVTQFGLPGLRQARRQLDAMAANGLNEVAVQIAANRFESVWRRQVGVKEAETALGRSIDYVIANDYRTVCAAINRGVRLADVRRRSKVERGIQQMIDAALGSIVQGGRATADTGPRLVAARPA